MNNIKKYDEFINESLFHLYDCKVKQNNYDYCKDEITKGLKNHDTIRLKISDEDGSIENYKNLIKTLNLEEKSVSDHESYKKVGYKTSIVDSINKNPINLEDEEEEEPFDNKYVEVEPGTFKPRNIDTKAGYERNKGETGNERYKKSLYMKRGW